MKKILYCIKYGKLTQKKAEKKSVKRLIKRLVKYDAWDKQKDSGYPQMTTTHQNEEAKEDLVCSKEDQLGTFMQPRDTEKLNISHFSKLKV